MADQFSETTSTSFGGNIVSSLKGVLFGFVLFIASFIILWLSEGQTDWSQVARESKPISEAGSQGEFVSISGNLVSSDQLGDPGFIKPGPYITLERQVEMYCWEENSESKTTKKVGGGSETTTTYTYKKTWSRNPEDSSGFKKPEGHYNPPMELSEETYRVASARIGQFKIKPKIISFPSGSELSLNSEISLVPDPSALKEVKAPETDSFEITKGETKLVPTPQTKGESANSKIRRTGNSIYIGEGSAQSPQVGDLRLTYLALPQGEEVTAFGMSGGDSLNPYQYEEDTEFYRALSGSRAQAISQLSGEYKLKVWIMRGIGFLAMWFGMMLMIGPIPTLLDVLPFLGNLGRGIFNLILFPLALVLSAITILVSKVAHNLIALLVVLAIILAGGIFWFKKAQGTRQLSPRQTEEKS